MKFITEELSQNPTFNTVVGLSNTNFDPENFIANRGATEGQIKVAHDMIKALQDWLDENGCSDDPYAIIRQKVDELEEAIGVCCANPQDTLIQMLNDRLTALQTAQEQCCQAMSDVAYQELVARLDALEASIDCNPCSGGTGTCDGNTITVSFAWNGSNPIQDGGQATAVSADATKTITGFYFLVLNSETGVYYKRSTAYGGDWTWSISASGAVIASYTGASGFVPPALGIVAVDENGCEGMIPVTLPKQFAVGG